MHDTIKSTERMILTQIFYQLFYNPNNCEKDN